MAGLFWLMGLVWARPLGPHASDVSAAMEMPSALPACDAAYPFALQRLEAAPELYHRFAPDRAYGVPQLILALTESTARVAARHPHADPPLIGDLSRSRGGALPPHRYHSDGRSADVGLYSRVGHQPRGGFVPVRTDLDVARTWELMNALLQTGNVEHILLDQQHINRIVGWLRAEGRMSEARVAATFPPVSTPRPWAWRSIVRHAPHHVDHMHVRIACE